MRDSLGLEFLVGILLLGSSSCLWAVWDISLYIQDFTPPRTVAYQNTESKVPSLFPYPWNKYIVLLRFFVCLFYFEFISPATKNWISIRASWYISTLPPLACKCAQSCPTLCDPVDWDLPGSSVHEIFQARILERIAIYSSSRYSWSRDQTQVSCIAGRFFTTWAIREAPFILFPFILTLVERKIKVFG